MASLFQSASVTLDGAGAGTIRLPAVPPFQRWAVERISLTITGGQSNLGGEARMFVNDSIPSNFIDGTNTPWNDVYAAALELLPPDHLVVVFSLCLANAIATVTIQGERSPL